MWSRELMPIPGINVAGSPCGKLRLTQLQLLQPFFQGSGLVCGPERMNKSGRVRLPWA